MHNVDRREHRRQLREFAAHERLAAGQPHVVDAHPGKQRDQPRDLLERQDRGSLQPRQPFRRHAVLAAEVAAIGDRYPQVADQPAVAIAQGFEIHRTEATLSAVRDPLDLIKPCRSRPA